MGNPDPIEIVSASLQEAARVHMLPDKAKLLALQLRAALDFQRQLQLAVATAVLQIVETGARYADADILAMLREWSGRGLIEAANAERSVAASVSIPRPRPHSTPECDLCGNVHFDRPCPDSGEP